MRHNSKNAGFWLMQVRTLTEMAARRYPYLTSAQKLPMSQIGANVIFLPFVVLSSSKDRGMSDIQLALFDSTSRPGKRAGNVFKA